MRSDLTFIDRMLSASHCADCLKHTETIACAIFLALVNRELYWLMLTTVRSGHVSIRI